MFSLQIAAATQLQAVEARKVFPVLDEPDRKARFTIKLGRPVSMNSRSNMPLESTEPLTLRKGYVMDSFQKTPKMSVYLLAFLISDFEEFSGNNSGEEKFNFSVLHRPGKAEEAALAANYGSKTMDFYKEYFDIEYPLPKLDAAALPDFKYGAMENWGLVTTEMLNN